MFKRDSKENLYYESEKTGRIYSLLEGIASNGSNSEIVFIFRNATEEEQDNDFFGEVVSWLYCGFEDLDFIEKIIVEYEKER